MWWRLIFGFRMALGGAGGTVSGPAVAPPVTGFLLLEDGVSFLLLEDGISKLLLE